MMELYSLYKCYNYLQATRSCSALKKKYARLAAPTKCCITAAAKSLFLHTARHKDAQRGRASRQPAIYYKSGVMLMMTYDGATDYTCNSE